MENILFKAKKTNEIYKYLGEGKLINLTRGSKGKLEESVLKDLFTIPLCLNNMAEKNPLVIDLIVKFSMSLEPLNDKEKNDLYEQVTKNIQGDCKD